MTELIHMTGDIFSTTARAIGHGVNTHGVMGAGIALQFRNRFPKMYHDYRLACRLNALQPGMVFTYEPFADYFVYNIVSQDRPGPHAQMEWLKNGVGNALDQAHEHGLDRIALPRIGSGIGGLNEKEVEEMLTRLAESSPVDIELWTYAPEV